MALHEQPVARIASTYSACEWCNRSIRKGHAMLVLPRGAGEVCGDCVRRAFATVNETHDAAVGLDPAKILSAIPPQPSVSAASHARA